MSEYQELQRALTDLEAENWLKRFAGRSPEAAKAIEEIREQKRLFDENREDIHVQYPGKWVGYKAGRLFVCDGEEMLSEQMMQFAPGKRAYAAEIPGVIG